MSGDGRIALGSAGEEAAAAHLRGLGYTILEANHRTRAGEIDLIAERAGHLCFVEVRSWRTDHFGEPFDWIPPRKRARLVRLANAWLSRHEGGWTEVTMGAALVRWHAGRPAVTFLADAFDGGDG